MYIERSGFAVIRAPDIIEKPVARDYFFRVFTKQFQKFVLL